MLRSFARASLVLFLIGFAFGQSTLRHELAQKAAQEGRLEDAIREYRALLLDDPRDAQSFVGIATIRQKQGKHKYALRNFQQALQINPTLEKALRGMGNSYVVLGQREKAVESLRKLLEHHPSKKSEVEALIAQILDPSISTKKVSTNSQSTKSISQTKGVQSSTHFSYDGPMFEKAMQLYNAQDYSQSLQYWRKVLKAQAGNPGAYYWAGVCRYNLNQLSKAKYNFKRSISYPDKGFNAHYYLGRIAEREGKPKWAIKHFKKYLNLTSSENGKKEVQDRINKLLVGSGNRSGETKTDVEGKEKFLSEEGEQKKDALQKGDPLHKNDTLQKEKQLPQKQNPESVQWIENKILYVIHDTKRPGGGIMRSLESTLRLKKVNDVVDGLKKVRLDYPTEKNAVAAGLNLTSLYLYLGLADQAANMARIVLRARPGAPYELALRFMLARALGDQKEWAQAQEVLSDLSENSILTPSKETLLKYKAMVDENLSDKNGKGHAQMLKAIDAAKDPVEKVKLQFQLGRILVGEADHAGAILQFKNILQNCTKATAKYCNQSRMELGDINYRGKNWIRAQEHYMSAAESIGKDSSGAWAYYQLGNVFRQQKEFKKAVEFYQTVLDKYPTSYWAEQARWKKDDAIWMERYQDVLQESP